MATTPPSVSQPWYSDSAIGRDRSHILQQARGHSSPQCVASPSSRFVLQSNGGMIHQQQQQDQEKRQPVPSPLWWMYEQLQSILLGGDYYDGTLDLLDGASMLAGNSARHFVAWVGSHQGLDYWVCFLHLDKGEKGDDNDPRKNSSLRLLELCQEQLQKQQPTNMPTSAPTVHLAGLREFGDALSNATDAALLATAQGLVQFHITHGFCSLCGHVTQLRQAGACRKCTNCATSVYPRLDVAAIMLISSHCQQYALLGRKAMWPQGRYSTLAGFAEIGETLEQCCIRETYEEAGIVVDPASVQTICSQPWPFPRSLMVGFRGTAVPAADGEGLPQIRVDEHEMESIQWFSKQYVRDHLDGGSTALESFDPTKREQEFHIPGRSSLARLLITQWAMED